MSATFRSLCYPAPGEGRKQLLNQRPPTVTGLVQTASLPVFAGSSAFKVVSQEESSGEAEASALRPHVAWHMLSVDGNPHIFSR